MSIENSNQIKTLIVDNEEKICSILAAILQAENYETAIANNGVDALKLCPVFKPHIAIVDLQMPKMNGIETIKRIKSILPSTVSIMLTAHGTIQSAVQAIKQGAFDYITKPFDNENLLLVVKRAVEVFKLTEEVDRLKSELGKKYGLANIIGESEVMFKLRTQIQQISESDATVLIQGESGTGKELIAKAIHYESKRKNKQLAILDCAAIPSNLIESEFFGYEKGAFTDAREQRTGKFEAANESTIFLDEIAELHIDAQSKLLRVLQEKEFMRVGGTHPVKVDVRIIAATNKNLEDNVKSGKFREDLFYRLDVLQIKVPPLRDHKEDIHLYARHFIAKHNESFGKNLKGITTDAVGFLQKHDWKGNIRELENAIQRAMLNAKEELIQIEDFVFLNDAGIKEINLENPLLIGLDAYLHNITEKIEREIIIKSLDETNGNRTLAADKLKISRKTLFNKMKLYNISD